MTMYTHHDATNAAGTYKGRGWTPGLWNDCPWNQIKENPQFGDVYFENFQNVDAGAWTVTVDTSGSLAPLAGAGGIGRFSAGAATDTQGILDANPGDSVGGWIVPTASTKIWYEVLCKPTNVAHGYWVGLATHGECLANTGEPNGTDRVGFLTDDSSALLFNYKDGGGSEYEIDTTDDLVTATWIRLGFKMEGLTRITPYINGLVPSTPGTVVATTTYPLPDAVMSPVFAVIANGTTIPTLDVDWVRIAVQYEPDDIILL